MKAFSGLSMMCGMLGILQAAYSQDRSEFSTMRNSDLASHLNSRATASGGSVDPRAQIVDTIQRSAGQRFRLNASRFDLSESDCVVFVERTIAIALSDDWDTYYLLCERLRHKGGEVGFRNRNFATLGDWLPNNAWLFEDVTRALGSPDDPPAQQFSHVVRPKVFVDEPAAPGSRYIRTIFKGSDYRSSLADVKTDWFIPRDRLKDVAADLRDGDVVLLLRNSSNGHLGCNHLGLLTIGTNGRVLLASSEPPEVRYLDLKAVLVDPVLRGFKVLRMRKDARELVRTEVERTRPLVQVPAPEHVDERVEKLRQARSHTSASENTNQ